MPAFGLGNLQTGLNENPLWPSVDGVCKYPYHTFT